MTQMETQEVYKPYDAKEDAKLQKIVHRYPHEVQNLLKTGDFDNDLYSALYDYYTSGDSPKTMPYGTQTARDGDPYEWIYQEFTDAMESTGATPYQAYNPAGSLAEAMDLVTNEAWDTETETPKSEQGKYEGKTKEELLKQYRKLKASGPHEKGSAAYEKMKELGFAVRAKSGWGKVKEEQVDEMDTANSGPAQAGQGYPAGDSQNGPAITVKPQKAADAKNDILSTFNKVFNKDQQVDEGFSSIVDFFANKYKDFSRDDVSAALQKVKKVLGDLDTDAATNSVLNTFLLRPEVAAKAAMSVAEGAENPAQQRILDAHPEELAEFLKTGYIDTTSDLYYEMYEYYADQMDPKTRRNQDAQYDFITNKIKQVAGAVNECGGEEVSIEVQPENEPMSQERNPLDAIVALANIKPVSVVARPIEMEQAGVITQKDYEDGMAEGIDDDDKYWDFKDLPQMMPNATRKVAGRAYGGSAQPYEPFDMGDEDEAPAKRGRGRPAGVKTKLGSQGPRGNSKLMSKAAIRESEDAVDVYDEYLDETYPVVKMEGTVLYPSTILRLCDPVAYRIGSNDYLEAELGDDFGDEELAESAVSRVLRHASFLTEGKVKPDFLDIDKDGNKKEPMKKAAKQVDEARLVSGDKLGIAGSLTPFYFSMIAKYLKAKGLESAAQLDAKDVKALASKLGTSAQSMADVVGFGRQAVDEARLVSGDKLGIQGQLTPFYFSMIAKYLKAKGLESVAQLDAKDVKALASKLGTSAQSMADVVGFGRQAVAEKSKISSLPDKLDELSPDTLKSYATKAKRDSKKRMSAALQGDELDTAGVKKAQDRFVKATKAKDLADKRWARDVKESEPTIKRDNRAEKAGKKVTKDLEYDMKHKGKDDKKAERAGKKVTKDIEYDEKKKKVKETTCAGSVAPAAAADNSAANSKYGFGQGIYESMDFEKAFNKEVKQLNEGLSININVDNSGQKSINVSATDEDADHLAEILKMAGMGGMAGAQGVSEEVCETCGAQQCECAMMEADELANGADDTEVANTDTLVNQFSGGLNGRQKQINPNNRGDNPMSMKGLDNKAVDLSLDLSESANSLIALINRMKK